MSLRRSVERIFRRSSLRFHNWIQRLRPICCEFDFAKNILWIKVLIGSFVVELERPQSDDSTRLTESTLRWLKLIRLRKLGCPRRWGRNQKGVIRIPKCMLNFHIDIVSPFPWYQLSVQFYLYVVWVCASRFGEGGRLAVAMGLCWHPFVYTMESYCSSKSALRVVIWRVTSAFDMDKLQNRLFIERLIACEGGGGEGSLSNPATHSSSYKLVRGYPHWVCSQAFPFNFFTACT